MYLAIIRRAKDIHTEDEFELHGFQEVLEYFAKSFIEGGTVEVYYRKPDDFQINFWALRKYNYAWRVIGEDERECNVLYLFVANYAALSQQTLLENGNEVWQKLGGKKYSWYGPSELMSLRSYDAQILDDSGTHHERLALLCALGLSPHSSYKQYSAIQIAEAYGLSKLLQVSFSEALVG
jgi:hypothetical protein